MSTLGKVFSCSCSHRDLKPDNMLLTMVEGELVLKICDFGTARQFEPNSLAETVCGTPIWMAPELLARKPYNRKVDVWSLGCILFYLLTKNTPFTGRNWMDLLRNIETKVWIIPRDVRISPSCRNLLAGMLQRNPEVRRVRSWEND